MATWNDAGVRRKPKAATAGPNADWVDPKTMGLTLQSTREADLAGLEALRLARPLKPPGRR